MKLHNEACFLATTGLVLLSCSDRAIDAAPTSGSQRERAAVSQSALGVSSHALLPRLTAAPETMGSTVPANGDLNPYGVAFVPSGFPSGGILRPGDVLVSNFNDGGDGGNLQGTGTSIVRVNPGGAPTLFFAGAALQGLSTALGVLREGLVLVGNLPSLDGSGSCNAGDGGQELAVGQGAITILDRRGRALQTLADAALLDGPWDMAVDDDGERAAVFVSNALSGTVTRLRLRVRDDGVTVDSMTQIASGYAHRCDPAAFVVGPTGLALDEEDDVLYVASTGDNAIYAVDHAETTSRDRGPGRVVVGDAAHLHGPLGLARTPTGHLISAQGDAVNPDPSQPNEIVEFSADGSFLSEFSIDPAPGSAFGIALERSRGVLRFAAVDDGANQLDEWVLKTP
ncbi:MAG: hypothetical protein ACRENE_27985 [Polyangiaceae bacterium]